MNRPLFCVLLVLWDLMFLLIYLFGACVVFDIYCISALLFDYCVVFVSDGAIVGYLISALCKCLFCFKGSSVVFKGSKERTKVYPLLNFSEFRLWCSQMNGSISLVVFLGSDEFLSWGTVVDVGIWRMLLAVCFTKFTWSTFVNWRKNSICCSW